MKPLICGLLVLAFGADGVLMAAGALGMWLLLDWVEARAG